MKRACAAVALALGPVSAAMLSSAAAQTDGVRYFPLAYYQEFEPRTALDLVTATPGFSFSQTGGGRGLSNVRVNVLIDGKRPPPKGQSISTQLNDLPAERVAYVELIDTGARPELDMQGFRQVLNLVTVRNPPPYAEGEYGFNRSGLGNINSSNGTTHSGAANGAFHLGPHKLTARGNLSRGVSKAAATFASINPDNPEQRTAERTQSQSSSESVNVTGDFDIGERHDLVVTGGFSRRSSSRSPVQAGVTGPDSIVNTGENASRDLNASLEYRNDLSEVLDGSLAFVFKRARSESQSDLLSPTLLRQSFSDTQSGETAGRAELRLTTFDDLTVTAKSHVARNFLDGATRLIDNGTPRDVGDAATAVSEWRGGGGLDLDWRPKDALSLFASLGVETYALEAMGVSDAQSDFTTRINANYKLAPRTSINMEATRAIGQLSFGQFLTSSSLESDIVSAGATSLSPERSWRYSILFDHRFNDRGVFQLRAERNVIDNPINSVPLSDSILVAQNTEPQRLDSFSGSFSYPLDDLGLEGGVFSVNGGIAQSRAIDPTTGEARPISGEPSNNWSFRLSRDGAGSDFSWSASLSDREAGDSFSPRAISRLEASPNWSGFVEWKGVENLRVRVNIAGSSSSQSQSLLFASLREPGLEPFFEQFNRTERDISVSGEIEWRIRENLEMTVTGASGAAQTTTSLLTPFGAEGGEPLERVFAATPTFGLRLRWTN